MFAKEAMAGAHLPYARHLDANTIQLRDGLLMQTIRLGGLLFETADTGELNYRAELRDAMLRALGSSRYAIYHHLVRRPAVISMSSEQPDDFSKWLDARWKSRSEARQHYVNELFLTIVRRPLQGRVGILDRLKGLASGSGRQNSERLQADLHALDNAREAMMAALGSYNPHLLSIYETTEGERSEPLEFLSWIFNHDMRPVMMPHGDLGHYIPARRVSFGQETVELAPAGPLSRNFTAMVSIKDWPGRTMPGIFDELTRLPFSFDVTQSFALVERREALSRMNLVLRRMQSAEDEALSLRDELVMAKDEVSAGRAGFGEHHMTIAVHAEDLKTLSANVAEVIALMADLGINAVREDMATEPAFWAQFPGNFRYIARRGLISTTNFASFASLHNFPVGKPTGNHWGDAVTLFETTAAGPYFFNFHHGDLGNFTIIGPSGSGKTVVLNFLLAQARKFSPRIIFFDKDRGAELFIRAIDGNYDRLSPGLPSGLNPLQLEDTAANRAFLAEWLALLAGGADAAELEQLREAIGISLSQPIARRRLRYLVELLRGGDRPRADDLYARLKPWWVSPVSAYGTDLRL